MSQQALTQAQQQHYAALQAQQQHLQQLQQLQQQGITIPMNMTSSQLANFNIQRQQAAGQLSYSEKTKKRIKSTKTSSPAKTYQPNFDDVPSPYQDPDLTSPVSVALGRYKRNFDMMSELLSLAPQLPIKREKRFIQYKQSDIDQLVMEIEAVKAAHAKKMNPEAEGTAIEAGN
ncbi:hypothetical protein HDU97_003412 [Phlyctochytrium planicorne]|nr:hypothetical protein HDU97_003412 [Phlyctochytrium planicorne]